MKNNRLIPCLLALLMALTPCFNALAEVSAADKSVASIPGSTQQHRITVTVPGEDKENRHDEILIMVDGSYSLDAEWPYAQAGILEIGRMVLNGKNDVRLTLMAFGMAPTVVAEHIETMEQLETLLNTYQGNLLYGRSSTNIEGAFIGIQRYLASHDDSLKDTTVIFVTDGGVNQHALPNKWLTEVSPKFIDSSYITSPLCMELDAVLAGKAVLSDATKAVFTTDEISSMNKSLQDNNLAAIQSLVESSYDGTVTKGSKWVQTVFADIYAYNQMSDQDGGYSVCDMERATLDYQNAKGLQIEDVFYYTAQVAGNISSGEVTNQMRALDAATELATNEKYHVDTMYLVQYGNHSRAEWMQFKTQNNAATYTMPDNVKHVSSGKVSNLAETIQKMLSDIALTPYNDVAIVDYMSKWVELLPETIRVLDQNDQVVAVYDAESSSPATGNYQYKWLIAPPLYSDKPPVTVEDVPESEYNLGGADVIGNASGMIKKVTWNIKQGSLLRTDNYRIEYDILVDVNEPGFEYFTAYPTNGNTYVHYIDENRLFRTYQITVPQITLEIPAPPPGEVPETGDNAHPIFWLAATILTGAALCLILRKKTERE